MSKLLVKRNLKVVCLALFLGFLPHQTLKSQVQTSPETSKLKNLAEAIAETETMLQKYPNNDFTPNLMFQLAELYVHRAKVRFQQEMELFEIAEKEFEQGLRQTEPKAPKVDYSEAFDITYWLLKKYPDVTFLNELFYKMSTYHLDVGNQDKAIEYFVHLAEYAEVKEVQEEANFRLGEYFFEQHDYPSAIEHYKRLLNSWDSPYFDMALYKLGWCYYNIEEYARAISTFIYLIDDINLLEEVDSDYLGKTKADLRSEAKEYIASCFAEFGGPQKARSFLSERKKEAYTEPVLLYLADLYKKRNFYDESIQTLNILLDLYPDTTSAPSYMKKIVENYELAGDKEKSTAMRSGFIAIYGPGSGWLNQQKDQAIRKDVLDTSADYLYSLGTEAQATAQAEKSRDQYELAIIRYKQFLNIFPESERAGKVWFYLAESLFDVDQYAAAADSYYELLLRYPESEFLETATYNRILAYNKLLAGSTMSDSTDLYLNNFLGLDTARVDTILVAEAVQAQFLQASNDFAIYLKDSPKLPEVLMKFAENLYVLRQYSLAKQAYNQVIENPATNGRLPQAYTMIAQCEFKQKNYEASEYWFQKLIDLHPDSSRYVVKANTMIASAKFKVAEDFLAHGDTLQAAREFEKIVASAREHEIAEKALFEAALLYEDSRDRNKAALLYESLPRKFPDSELIDKALFKAGILREELQQWSQSAMNFLAVFDHDPASQFAANSLYFAARNFENAGDYKNARNYFERYITIYKDDPDRFLDAAFKKGEIAYNQRDFTTALRDFNFVISSHKKFRADGAPVDNYFPANAQFLIGEVLYDTFKKIQLSPPLDRNLERKRAKFQEVVKAYAAAAKYKSAEWSTASSYKIGVSFEEFANALLDSSRPKNMTDEDLIAYNQKLWQSVLPFKRKAYKTYKSNVRQAEKNSIENKWIEESKRRLGVLGAELDTSTLDSDDSGPKSSTN